MKNSRVLAIQDLCASGATGLSVTVPVLLAAGVSVYSLPLSVTSDVLSAKEVVTADVTATATAIMDAWQNQGITFDAIYSSAVTTASAPIVADALKRFKGEKTIVIIDPVLGDNGSRYEYLSDDVVTAMQGLISSATVITPNVTEACLLTGIPYDQVAGFSLPPDMLQMGCSMLSDLGPEKVVVTDMPTEEGQFKVITYDRKTNVYYEVTRPRLPLSVPGMGDAFTSVLTGSLLAGQTLGDAAENAASFVSSCLQYMSDNGIDGAEGILVTPRHSQFGK